LDKTTEVVSRQIAAMGCTTFEMGLFMPDASSGAGPVMIPRTWDADCLLRSIPWMRLQNLQGRNIYIRPYGEHNLTMVDDLKAASIDRMFSSGFKPAVVVETSPGSFQAWLKHSRVLNKDLSTAVARTLAQEFEGDKGAADWRHFGRLAGFTNRKLKYQNAEGFFPFVRLHAVSGAIYAQSDRFVHEVELALARQRERTLQDGATYRQHSSGSRRTIESFRGNPVYGGDGTRIDLAFAIYALSHGVPHEHVRAAIRSRDLSHKGDEKRQAEYVERTVKKALSVVERNGITQER
jgi:RepB DNA-primase from phage plasmid